MSNDRTVGVSAPRGGTKDLPFAMEEGDLAPGTRVGEYVIEGTLAAGGCGTVYSAVHRMLGRRVALKLLHGALATSAEMVERFVREARIVNQIRSPQIVDVQDLSTLPDGRPYMVMELLRGSSLRALLERRVRMTAQEALAVLRPICNALQTAHEAGIVHRDLKASNVMVVKEGDQPEVKLLDFGIAKLLRTDGQPGLTSVGQRLGTPYAMSPEQIRGGEIDGRADVYALGVLLYQLLTGQVPFASEDLTELERLHLEAPPPHASARAPVLPALDKLIVETMAKDPADRPQSAREFIARLAAIVEPPAPGAARTAGRGVGVYVEVQLRAGAAEDDEALIALGSLLDLAEAELRDAGLSLYLSTGSALLGVAAFPAHVAAAESLRAAAREAAGHIRAAAAELGQGKVTVQARVHEDVADLESENGVLRVKGGPLAQVGSWPAAERRGPPDPTDP